MTLVDDVLEGLSLRSAVFSRMTMHGDWGFAKDRLPGAPFHLILSGDAFVRIDQDGPADVIALGPGDVIILPRGQPHLLLSRPDAPHRPWRQVVEREGWQEWTADSRFKTVDLQLGEGERSAQLISGIYAFEDQRRNPLLDALPAVLVLRSRESSPAARAAAALLPLIEAEIVSGIPGAESVCTRLADILFIQTVRHHLGHPDRLPRGWLRGMTSPALARVLGAIHRAPGMPWTVASLGREGGMSRSRFAARFRETVGQAPLDYLTDWRMYLAAGRLADGRLPPAVIAEMVGYASPVSFGRSFRKWCGQSPAAYRRQPGAAEAAADGVDGTTASASDTMPPSPGKQRQAGVPGQAGDE